MRNGGCPYGNNRTAVSAKRKGAAVQGAEGESAKKVRESPGKRGSGREAVSLCNSCEGGHSGPCVVQAEFLYAGAAPVQLYRNALYCFSQRAGADANVGGGKYLYVPKMVKSGFKDVKNKEYRRQPWYQPWLLLGLLERE